MNMKEKVIRPHSEIGSGRVKQYIFPKGRKVTQITTFCPDIIGPGPTHVYVIEDKVLTMVDTGIPTYLAKELFYYWRNQKIPSEVKSLPDDFSETELITGLKEVGYSLSGLINEIKPAAQILEEMIEEAADILTSKLSERLLIK